MYISYHFGERGKSVQDSESRVVYKLAPSVAENELQRLEFAWERIV